MVHALALHHLSLRDVPPDALPALAAGAGLSRVSVFVRAPSPRLDIFPRVRDAAGARALENALRAEGVTVHNIEVISIEPGTDPDTLAPALDLGARIGARRVTTLVQDADHARAAGAVARLAEMAGARGIAVSLEFMAFSRLRSIGEAAGFVARVGHENLSLLVDPLHLFRTGGSVADLAATDPALIGAAQLCDGPAEAPENPFAEAVEDRALPGSGAFPLSGFVNALPAQVPIDLEVPMKRLADAGLGPAERADRLVKAARATLSAAATG